jgi:hypothetical protein
LLDAINRINAEKTERVENKRKEFNAESKLLTKNLLTDRSGYRKL